MRIKNFPYAIVKRHAKSIKRGVGSSLLAFDDQVVGFYQKILKQASLAQKDFSKEGAKDIVLLDNYVVKSEKRGMSKRLRLLYGNSPDRLGHRGVIGEAINTLAANKTNLPSHKLAAMRINFINGECDLIFERIKEKLPLAKLIDQMSDDELREALIKIIFQIAQHCQLPLLHPECHTEHIFCNKDGSDVQLIDYERSVKSSCSADNLTAITLTRIIRDSKVYDRVSFDEFLSIVESCHNQYKCFESLDEVRKVLSEINDIPKKDQHGRSLNDKVKPQGALSDLLVE